MIKEIIKKQEDIELQYLYKKRELKQNYIKATEELSKQLELSAPIKVGDIVVINRAYKYSGKKARVLEVGFVINPLLRELTYVAGALVQIIKKDGTDAMGKTVAVFSSLEKVE